MHDLISLIQASNFGGLAGQSFRNHVTGAVDGVRMTDYIIASASWGMSPAYDVTNVILPSSSVLTGLSASFSIYGPLAGAIQDKTTANWTVDYDSPEFGTAGATITSVNRVDNVITPSITLLGELTPGSPSISHVGWYNGYIPNVTYPYTNPPDGPPGMEQDYTVYYVATATGTPGSGSTLNTLRLSYAPDLNSAGFNALVFGPGPTTVETWAVKQERRGTPAPDTIYAEWHSDGTYTNIRESGTGSAPFFAFQSFTYTVEPYWFRYRFSQTGSWVDYGDVSWSDPRLDI